MGDTGRAVLARRSLGYHLRTLRKAAGISQAAAGRAAELSAQSIGRLEDGQATRISRLHLDALCDTYGASDPERAVLLNLMRETRTVRRSTQRWWSGYADLVPAEFDRRLILEETASTVTAFHDVMVPDLLRTPDYHRAVERTVHPRDISENIERRGEITRRRQEKLYSNGFDFTAYLLQSVLHHSIGGPAVMLKQLSHLDEASRLPNASIRIIPDAAGSHIGLHIGAFVLLEFATLPTTGLVEPPIVYTEGFTGDTCLEHDRETEPYRRALEDLDRIALDEDRSRTLLNEDANGHKHLRGGSRDPSR